MSLPLIEETPQGYSFTWDAEQVSIELAHINSRNGSSTAEITVSTTLPGYGNHLHQARFSLTDTAKRKTLQKNLESITKDDIDWYPILEQLCVYSLERIRRGEPVKELWTGGEIKPPQFLINPLIVKNYPAIFFGDPGSGKSTIAQVLIPALTLPWYDNSIGLQTLISESNPCLYLDYETDEDTVLWSISRIQRGMNLPEFGVHYRRCFMPLADEVNEIVKILKETGCTVAIIDSAALACGGELVESGPVLAMFNALRKLGVTVILLAHNSKGEGKKHPYGSIFFEAMARTIWEVKKVQEPDSSEEDIAMYHRKAPPFGKLHSPLSFHVTFDDAEGKTIIKKQDARNVAEFVDGMSDTTRIYEALRDGPMNNAELSEELGIASNNIRQATFQLKRKGEIIKLTDNKWAILQKGEL